MAETPKWGEHWIDLRPMTDRKEWRDSTRYRRCIEVTEVDSSFVHGRSYWETTLRTGTWTAMDYPPPRKVRILAHVFERRFIRKDP